MSAPTDMTKEDAVSELRDWTDDELAGVFLADDPTVSVLFRFVQQESYDGQVQSGEPVTAPKFNFYVRARRRNGTAGPNVAFEYEKAGTSSGSS